MDNGLDFSIEEHVILHAKSHGLVMRLNIQAILVNQTVMNIVSNYLNVSTQVTLLVGFTKFPMSMKNNDLWA